MEVFLALGVFALVFALLFLFSPTSLQQMSEWLNRTVVQNDARAMANRRAVGVFLLLASVVLFYAAYRMYR
jgi:hypothetical protein